MKHSYSRLTSLLLLLFLAIGTQRAAAQTPDEVFAKITAAIQTGNAESLGAYFQSPVEITLPGTDQSYSAQQATFVLKDFFAKNPPKSYTVVHKGSSGATNYATGLYTGTKGNFDTNIFLKKADNGYKITQIRFEPE